MKKLILFVLTLFVSAVHTWGQEISNISFEVVQTDISAYLNPKMDNNNQACALVKVNYYKPGVKFEGNVIGVPEYKNSQYLVYVTSGTNYLNIIVPEHRPKMIKFSDYGYNGLESKTTYKLCFDPDKSVKDLPNPNVIFNKALREPKEYTLSINRNGGTIYLTTDDWNNLSNIEKQKLSIDGLVIPDNTEHDAFLLTLYDAEPNEIERQIALEKYGTILPTAAMAESFLGRRSIINEKLMNYGFPEIIEGDYHTQSLLFGVWSFGTMKIYYPKMTAKGRVRLVKPLASKKLGVAPTWWSRASVWPIPLSLQVQWAGETRYVLINDYVKDPTSVNGVVLMQGNKCFIVELQDAPGTYDAGQISKYAEFLPDYEEGEILSLNMVNLNQIFKQINGAQPFIIDENDNPYYWTTAISYSYICWTVSEDGKPMLVRCMGDDDVCRIRRIHRLK